jgi:flagellin-like protein
MKKGSEMMRKNRGVSAVIGVILMVAITVAIAATVYWYVSQFEEQYMTGTEKIIDYAEHINWSQYDNTSAPNSFVHVIGDVYLMTGDGWMETVKIHANGTVEKVDKQWFENAIDTQCTTLTIDFQAIKDNNDLLTAYRDNWYSIPGKMISCVGPWNDKNVNCYFNMENDLSYVMVNQ